MIGLPAGDVGCALISVFYDNEVKNASTTDRGVFAFWMRWEAEGVQSKTIVSLIQRLRDLREAHGLTQEGFAEKAGISYKYYQAVEAGRKRELRLSTLERLARAYGIEVWELLAPPMPKARLPGAPKGDRIQRK